MSFKKKRKPFSKPCQIHWAEIPAQANYRQNIHNYNHRRVIEVIKILFVCHGNICRSPMAEFVMKDLIKKKGLAEKFEIASAATSTEELGNPVYPPAKKKLAEYGISCNGKTARRMTAEDYRYYDYIIARDRNNHRNMIRFVGDDPDKKVSLLMEHTPIPRDVADPWYTGDFQQTWEDVSEGCMGVLNELGIQ